MQLVSMFRLPPRIPARVAVLSAAFLCLPAAAQNDSGSDGAGPATGMRDARQTVQAGAPGGDNANMPPRDWRTINRDLAATRYSPLEEINREAPLQPVFFGYDSSEINAAARGVIATNADVLSQNPTWVIAIEGHCDSRGTPEYNLALGERRAYAVRDHLVGLGIAADRMQTISYGEEFPFVPGETEDAWASNRRAHFVITGQ